MDLSDQITEELIREVRRRLIEESMPRIKKCLDRLTDDQIWWRPNRESNSIGNLVLHLSGNVRQWIISGIGGQVDERLRSEEFDSRGPMPKMELWDNLSTTMSDMDSVLDAVTATQLVTVQPVQVYKESVLSMLIHVTEHFSYHTGQIAWITKMLTERQLGFYKGIEL
jgi:uncharacterized damage-inducible protein DinB